MRRCLKKLAKYAKMFKTTCKVCKEVGQQVYKAKLAVATQELQKNLWFKMLIG